MATLRRRRRRRRRRKTRRKRGRGNGNALNSLLRHKGQRGRTHSSKSPGRRASQEALRRLERHKTRRAPRETRSAALREFAGRVPPPSEQPPNVPIPIVPAPVTNNAARAHRIMLKNRGRRAQELRSGTPTFGEQFQGAGAGNLAAAREATVSEHYDPRDSEWTQVRKIGVPSNQNPGFFRRLFSKKKKKKKKKTRADLDWERHTNSGGRRRRSRRKRRRRRRRRKTRKHRGGFGNNEYVPFGTFVKLNAEGRAHFTPLLQAAAAAQQHPSYQDPIRWRGRTLPYPLSRPPPPNRNEFLVVDPTLVVFPPPPLPVGPGWPPLNPNAPGPMPWIRKRFLERDTLAHGVYGEPTLRIHQELGGRVAAKRGRIRDQMEALKESGLGGRLPEDGFERNISKYLPGATGGGRTRRRRRRRRRSRSKRGGNQEECCISTKCPPKGYSLVKNAPPPPPPPGPTAASGATKQGSQVARGALLGSIQGFKKGALKKASKAKSKKASKGKGGLLAAIRARPKLKGKAEQTKLKPKPKPKPGKRSALGAMSNAITAHRGKMGYTNNNNNNNNNDGEPNPWN